MLAQLEITFHDGSRRTVATTPDWRTAESPIRESLISIGETYDARLEQAGWDTASFDDAHWLRAETAPVPSCQVIAHMGPPIRLMQILRPIAISEPKPGVYVFDLGQNFAGWCRLRTKGSNGTRIEMQFAELLLPSGEPEFSPGSMGLPKIDVFILQGSSEQETFEPHFTYRGFRYVQVTGLEVAPTLDSLEGCVVHSEMDIVGQLRADSPALERLWRNVVWTQRSNCVSILTDCPSREQRGWMADAAIFCDTAAFNMDIQGFMSRQMQHSLDDQNADGEFHVAVPEPRYNNSGFMRGSGPVWADGSIVIPWTIWRHYGDTALIERTWEAMNRYLQSILDKNPDYVSRNRNWGLGDHLALDGPDQAAFVPQPLPSTPKELVGTAYWAYGAQLLAQMSEAIGRHEDTARLRLLSERVRRAFNETFVKSDGTVGTGSQTGYILALHFGLLPEACRQAAAERLAASIRDRGVSLTTGIVGTQFALDALIEAGLTDLAYEILLRTEYPSWGYMLEHGATTIWESWNGKGILNGKLRQKSLNHPALGSVGSFLLRRIAGIDAASAGFESIVIRPRIGPRVKKGGGDYYSMMGRISTDWAQEDGAFTLRVVIPPNTTARIHVPARRGSHIREGREDASSWQGIRLVARHDHEAVIHAGSGSYRFVVS